MGAELTVADFRRAGVAPHLRREITAALCDADGFLAPVAPKLGKPDEPWDQGVMDQVWGSVEGFVWPALEMRVLTRRTPRQGDVLETYAALLNVSHKIIHSGVWVFEARSQALVSVSHQVNIFFRLATRRPQDMAPETRERLSRLVTPGLIPDLGH
jgi:acyl-CoA thioesterase FadM